MYDFNAVSKSTIVVVDDDKNIRDLFRHLPALPGCRVIEAASGLEALEVVKTQTPDLIITDILMPGLDGFSVCRQLKAIPEMRHMPIFMMTGLVDQSVIHTALDAGADHVLVKPFNLVETALRIRNAIALKRHYDRLLGRQNEASGTPSKPDTSTPATHKG